MISPFTASIAGVPVNNSVCITSGPGAGTLPATLPATFTGSVLLGPCTGAYGDPLLTADPYGEQHGILFFQNRSSSPSGGDQPSWGGGGVFFVAGNMYFHNSTTYGDTFSFQAGSSGGYFFGAIVADQFTVGGNSQLNMYLSANSGYIDLKASLIR